MMGIFEDLKTNEVDPDVEPEVIVDKIGLMQEILNLSIYSTKKW